MGLIWDCEVLGGRRGHEASVKLFGGRERLEVLFTPEKEMC